MDRGQSRCCWFRTVRRWSFALVIPAVLLVISCRGTGLQPEDDRPSQNSFVAVAISSDDGGIVAHPLGATLSIPPGALSLDTTVVITDKGVSPIDPYSPMVPVSRRFTVDLGRAAVLEELTLNLVYSDPQLPTGQVDVENLVLVSPIAEGVHRICSATSESGPQMHVSASLRKDRELVADVARSFELQYIVPIEEPVIFALLQAPFYLQDGLNWCVPTSTAMLYNYHVWKPDVRSSNWQIAGLAKTPRGTDGVPADGVLDKSGAKGLYTGYYWDADLIPSAPLTHFLQSITHGWDVVELFGSGEFAAVNKIDPRPILTCSESKPGVPSLHAYLVVGASSTGLRIHDSSGALTGIGGLAGYMSWEEYRDTIAKDGEMDAWTAHMSLPVRPEEQRRGSIVLRGGATNTIKYQPLPDNDDLSYDWLWDGEEPYSNGCYWSRRSQPATEDEELGHAFDLLVDGGMLAGVMRCRPRIANLTTTERTYRIVTYIAQGTPVEQIIDFVVTESFTVPAHRWDHPLLEHELDMTPITDPGLYRLSFLLYESNVLQDNKTVLFRVAE